MALPSTYTEPNCSLARALEVVGERWTLLIIRDAFFGVRRFGDFATQLRIPRAVLTSRLKTLVREGVLTRDKDATGAVEYRLTDRGVALWPAVHALTRWGDQSYSPTGSKRAFRHDEDGGLIGDQNRCQVCDALVPVTEIRTEPGPGYTSTGAELDPVSKALTRPRLLLEPVTTTH